MEQRDRQTNAWNFARDLLSSCVATSGTVDIRADTRLMGRTEAAAQFTAPEGGSSPRRSRIASTCAPDNSSLTATITPVLMTRQVPATRGAGGAGRRFKNAEYTSSPTSSTSPPSPARRPGRRTARSRPRDVRNGARRVDCSVGVERVGTLGADCRRALESLSILTVGAAPAQPEPQQPAIQQPAPGCSSRRLRFSSRRRKLSLLRKPSSARCRAAGSRGAAVARGRPGTSSDRVARAVAISKEGLDPRSTCWELLRAPSERSAELG